MKEGILDIALVDKNGAVYNLRADADQLAPISREIPGDNLYYFLGLTDRLLDGKRVLYETELIKRRAELSFLQSQINPHFLYNTLESIKGLAADEGSSQIFELTEALRRGYYNTGLKQTL